MDQPLPPPEAPDRLSDPKLLLLGDMLDQVDTDDAMDLEELDGFFCALHCGPALVSISECTPEILGGDYDFPDPAAAQLFADLLANHWNDVGAAFHQDTAFDPIFLQYDDSKVYGNNWAIGFLRGIDMRKDQWADVMDDTIAALLSPILRLAYELEPDAPLPDFAGKPIPDEERDGALEDLCVAVTDIYDHLAPHRVSHDAFSAAPQTPGKIGRNDPCYCGSGKKYKKCCGGIAVN